MNRSSNRKGRKSANRVRKYSGGGTHFTALTRKWHTLTEVDESLIMINEMITNAGKDSILNLSPLSSQLTEVKRQLTEVKERGQKWEEKELARREEAGEAGEAERIAQEDEPDEGEKLALKEKADAEEAERIAQRAELAGLTFGELSRRARQMDARKNLVSKAIDSGEKDAVIGIIVEAMAKDATEEAEEEAERRSRVAAAEEEEVRHSNLRHGEGGLWTPPEETDHARGEDSLGEHSQWSRPQGYSFNRYGD